MKTQLQLTICHSIFTRCLTTSFWICSRKFDIHRPAMSAVSAANSIQYVDFISASSDGTSMVTEIYSDDDAFMSSDDVSDELRLRSEVLHLPTELQSQILEFQYKSRVRVRTGVKVCRAAGCEHCGVSPCACRKRNRAWQHSVMEARRFQQQSLRTNMPSRVFAPGQ